MKKYNHPTDEFLREALRDHRMTPSDDARQAFLKDVMQIPPPKNKGRKGLILLSAVTLLVVSGIFIWGNSSHEFSVEPIRKIKASMKGSPMSAMNTTSSEKTNSNEIKQLKNTGKLYNNLTEHQPQKQKFLPPPAQTLISKQGRSACVSGSQTGRTQETPQLQKTAEQNSQLQQSHPETPVAAGLTAREGEPVPLAATIAPDAGKVQNNVPVTPNTPGLDTTSLIKKPDSLVKPAPIPEGKPADRSRKPGNWTIDPGIYYTPEWMFNTLEGTKFVNNFGFEGTFHFGRFSVRTGAGLSVASGTNELIVEYNDFLGAYNKLDSMKFTWSDPAHNYIPTMYLSKQNVWDSLMKLDNPKVVKRYTYLQIPMIMGYDFFQTERISIGVRVGPVLSVLLSSKQLSAAYDPGTKRIISINDISPGQVSLNWQLMAGMNTSFRISELLKFEIEPNVRYYFNSVYEKPVNNTKPWSIGLRTAFVISL